MKKNNKAKKEQQPQGRGPKQPKGVTELTEKELEQVQGGKGSGGGALTETISVNF